MSLESCENDGRRPGAAASTVRGASTAGASHPRRPPQTRRTGGRVRGYNRRVRPVIVVALALPWLAPAAAEARSCIGHAYETMALQRLDVRAGGVSAPAPPGLAAFDELLNSGEGGASLLFWNHASDWERGAKWFASRQAIEPTPIQAQHIAEVAARDLKTSCGYMVDYTPILPGRYTYKEDHSGEPVSVGVDARSLEVTADRQRVIFTFVADGQEYEATYAVTCAHFDWEHKEPRRCGPGGSATVGPDAPPAVEGHGCDITEPPAAWLLVLVGVAVGRHRRRRERGAR